MIQNFDYWFFITQAVACWVMAFHCWLNPHQEIICAVWLLYGALSLFNAGQVKKKMRKSS